MIKKLINNIKASATKRKQRKADIEANYFARALLMPKEQMLSLIRAMDYKNMSPEDKQRFAWKVSDKFQVPVQQAERRILELIKMYGSSEKEHDSGYEI